MPSSDMSHDSTSWQGLASRTHSQSRSRKRSSSSAQIVPPPGKSFCSSLQPKDIGTKMWLTGRAEGGAGTRWVGRSSRTGTRTADLVNILERETEGLVNITAWWVNGYVVTVVARDGDESLAAEAGGGDGIGCCERVRRAGRGKASG